MGFDLSNSKQDYARFSWSTWRFLLETARKFGWQPQGTVDPIYSDDYWSGGYHSNDGQRVLEEDADALVDALEEALLSNREDPEKKLCLKRMISFCRKGAFRIY
jgi:hypothetical protein